MRYTLILIALLTLTGCQSARPLDGPFIRVLGTAQDAGIPHTACYCERCEQARTEPAARRFVSCISLVVPQEERPAVYLFDATPDITRQLHLLRDVRPRPETRTDRTPLAGVFLTHAHMGHYLGLAWLGFESIHARGIPVYCTPRMAGFLRGNGPWSQLVEMENIALREMEHEVAAQLHEDIRVTAHQVPHRDEYSDTVAFRIEGPRRTIVYLPDTEPWPRWPTPFLEWLEGVDVLLVDATFYSADEMPGRRVESIGHPLMVDTMDLLEPLVQSGELEVWFIHLNHSNPAVTPNGAAEQTVEKRGFNVAREGVELEL